MLIAVPALPAMASGSEDLATVQERTLAHEQARHDRPSSLAPSDAVQLLAAMAQGDDVGASDADELARFLRDAEGTATFDQVLLAMVDEVAGVRADAWQAGLSNQLGPVLGVAYDGACVHVSEVCLHNQRLLGSQFTGGLYSAGCHGNYYYGHCSYRYAYDVLALASIDRHLSRDLTFVQSPFSYNYDYSYQCGYSWAWDWGWCVYYAISVYSTVLQMASDVQYEFAVPVAAASLATRATDPDFRLGGSLNYAKPREATSASPLAGTPIDDALLGTPAQGTPGLGDLVAAAPVPTAFGLQKPGRVPERPGFPATPADPFLTGQPPAAALYDQLQSAYADVSVRTRDFGSLVARTGMVVANKDVADYLGPVAVNSTGVTVLYEATAVLTGTTNVLMVRIKPYGAGPGPTGLPAGLGEKVPAVAPGSFYYDTGTHFFGGGNRATYDFRLAHPVDGLPV